MVDTVNDRDLDLVIRAVRAGDRQRYAEVVIALETRVRVVLSLMIPDRTLVEDLAHEVFVLAYLKLGEYSEGTDFSAWIKAIARNLAHNERRRWLRERKFTTRYVADIEDTLVGPAVDALIEQSEREEKAELWIVLHECIEGLGAVARETVRKFYFGGASVADISTQSGRSLSAIKVLLFRARAALVACMVGKGVRL
jgi:RNA polymerase sigma-70 factor (ECF subfamily)